MEKHISNQGKNITLREEKLPEWFFEDQTSEPIVLTAEQEIERQQEKERLIQLIKENQAKRKK